MFDIDDTLLNTYDYEIANQFGFTPATNATFVNAAAFPAVFYMPGLVSFAASHGYAVFFITSLGYSIMADFGDQYSDLLGGDAGHQVKIPNPMYYLP